MHWSLVPFHIIHWWCMCTWWRIWSLYRNCCFIEIQIIIIYLNIYSLMKFKRQKICLLPSNLSSSEDGLPETSEVPWTIIFPADTGLLPGLWREIIIISKWNNYPTNMKLVSVSPNGYCVYLRNLFGWFTIAANYPSTPKWSLCTVCSLFMRI